MARSKKLSDFPETGLGAFLKYSLTKFSSKASSHSKSSSQTFLQPGLQSLIFHGVPMQGRSESTQTPELIVLKWRTSYVKVKGNKPVKRRSYTKETASLKPFATILSQSLLSNNFIVRAKRNRGWQPINLCEFLEFVSHVIYILIIVISL